MENVDFKKICRGAFKEKGFSNKGSSYIKHLEDLSILICLEKDRFNEGIRIVVYYYLHSLLNSLDDIGKIPQHMDGRFIYPESTHIDKSLILLAEVDLEKLKSIIKLNSQLFIDDISSFDYLKKVMHKLPQFDILSKKVEDMVQSEKSKINTGIMPPKKSFLQSLIKKIGF
jgi:hypothetical protein